MATITEVTLQNFRGFEKLDALRLAPLTFLVGPNSSGKSSIADAILFMAQSGFLSLEATNPIWVGPLVDLGSFKDTVFRHEMSRTIEVRVRLDLRAGGTKPSRSRPPKGKAPLPETTSIEVTALVRTAKNAPEGRLTRLSVRGPGADESVDLVRRPGQRESFYARAAGKREHYDPRRPWDTPAGALARAKDGPLAWVLPGGPPLGPIAASVQRVSSGRNPPQRSYARDGGSAQERSRRLLDSIDATALDRPDRRKLLDKLVKGLLALGIADDLDVARLSDYHTAVHLRDNLTGIVSNLAEFGYGASQVLPVLEGCAAPGPGPLFIEQPEIHLHPRAQGALSQILCDASRKRQMIVETHSEHMINRARRLVAEGKMKPEDIVIQYVDRDEGGSHAIAIGLDDAGDFTRDWPDGFFDERYRETIKIAEAQAKRAAR